MLEFPMTQANNHLLALLLYFEAAGTAPLSFVTDNIQHITTEVGRENLKWTASSMFGGT
jgi:hypothetical protein